MRALLVNPLLVGIHVHWSDQTLRTIVCPGPTLCPLCLAAKRSRWLAFASALLPGKVKAVVQITWEAARSLLDGLDKENTFAGVQVQLKRIHPQRTSRVVAQFVGRTAIPDGYRTWPELQTLTHLFGPITRFTTYTPSDLASVFYFDQSEHTAG